MRNLWFVMLVAAVGQAHAQAPNGIDKQCIFAAARQIPPIQGTEITASRLKVAEIPKGAPKGADVRLVEIDIRAAGQTATYQFNCVVTETRVLAILLEVL